MTITTIGAWTGLTSLVRPGRDVEFAAECGINRLDLVVNDHSKWRTEKDFTIRSRSKIEAFTKAAQARGIEVHVMSWVMPYRRYIDGAAQQLIPLCRDLGIASLQWDAEEPWTLARGGLDHEAASTYIAEAFKELACPMGANAIGYTPVTKFAPLAAVCDYIVPQAYATSSSGLDPAEAPRRFHRRYQDRFNRPIVMGLAAYRQSGIEGHTPESAIRTALESTAELGVSTVIYWSLAAIRRSPRIAAELRRYRLDTGANV